MNKLIGIFNNPSKLFIKGIFLKIIIDKFNKIIRVNNGELENKNEIDILIKIYKEDINKEIYFLNNNFIDNNKYLNGANTELYINEKLYKFKKYFKPNKEGDYKIKLKFGINLTDCSYMFANCKKIIKLNFNSFNTYFVKNMKYMFYKCTNLEEINLLSFDTTNVIDMSYIFYECENLFNLDISFINENLIKNYISSLFKNLHLLDLLNFINIEKLGYVEVIFYNYKKMKGLNLPVSNIINSNFPKINKELILFLLNNENKIKLNF